ncbi:hypothetical protein CERSUDRAFT_116458 [Gelatoporia subvermispora B]|uniref:Uncharacterized protein n=1 Tax=Ceriporiopsis subvermispora (strain B) TaxID=914234 RepID=M2R8D6_CERS8|nr:hypothetical protein CERSUDRAFT_116458 [Gelatoporia subvermispora B]
MFSSLSSFLPAALHSPGDKSAFPGTPSARPTLPHQETTPNLHEQQEQQLINETQNTMPADEQAQRKKKERTHESFIVVRPPPAKTNHPLNLQVQLVPPSNARPSSSRRSIDSTSSPDPLGPSDTALSRSSSRRSDTSLYSAYSTYSGASAVSVGSTTSTASTASGSTTHTRRMIIPLYNLQAHNVMTNVLVDAGTDAKVAKYVKRGLEVIGLAVLEPIELWGVPYAEVEARPASDDFSPAHMQSPGSSAQSLMSDTMPEPAATPERGQRKFLGRLFKRKDASATPTSASPTTSRTPHAPPTPIPVPMPIPELVVPEPAPAGQTQVAQQPVLGIQATLRAERFPPKGRATQYVWVVRRWLKGEGESGSVAGKGSGLGRAGRGMREGVREVVGGRKGGLESMVEVRFEWVRGRSSRKKPGRERARGSRSRARGDSRERERSVSPSVPSVTTNTAEDGEEEDERAARRASSSTGTGRGRSEYDDEGADSDPEDSETPWTCTLVVRRLAPQGRPHSSIGFPGQPALSPVPAHAKSTSTHARPSSSHAPLSPSPPSASTSSSPQTLRIKVAAVVPTPHHPKVVSLLKVPFPLPDVEIPRVRARRRIITPMGVARPAADDEVPPPPPLESASSENGKTNSASRIWGALSGGSEGLPPGQSDLVLTAEEIKDVVSATGLWLVVREGFGGVGRERRRGDGWKLRG